MNIYPASPIPGFPLSETYEDKTLVTDIESSKEQRRQIWAFPKRHLQVRYQDGLTQSEIDILWNFYRQQNGRRDSFWFFYPYSMSFEGEFVNQGDGVTEVFDLPGKTTSLQLIYVNSVLQTITVDYVILTGTGDAGVDQVDFVVAPSSGEVITCDFTGIFRLKARFSEAKLSRTIFSVLLYRIGIPLIEVK